MSLYLEAKTIQGRERRKRVFGRDVSLYSLSKIPHLEWIAI